MEPYSYHNPQSELFGYSPNDVLYMAISPEDCAAISKMKCTRDPQDPTVGAKDNTNGGTGTTTNNAEVCMLQDICRNQALMQANLQPRVTDGRLVDSKNLYVQQMVHTVNLFLGSLGLAVYLYGQIRA